MSQPNSISEYRVALKRADAKIARLEAEVQRRKEVEEGLRAQVRDLQAKLEAAQRAAKRQAGKPKPFEISKEAVYAAYLRVKAKDGGPGVDGESIEEFERNLEGNLYKLWNRMSSGSYLPPPLRMVEIPKPDGRVRVLGVPTVADRIAQTVVKLYLEPVVEPIFHEDSYGYRPRKARR